MKINKTFLYHLLPFLLILIYCAVVTFGIFKLAFILRVAFLTLLYYLILITELEFFKNFLYHNIEATITTSIIFAAIGYLIDAKSFGIWLYFCILPMLVYLILSLRNKTFSILSFFSKVSQLFLIYSIVCIWWDLALDITWNLIRDDIIFDGVEIMVISAVLPIYFWSIEIREIKKTNKPQI